MQKQDFRWAPSPQAGLPPSPPSPCCAALSSPSEASRLSLALSALQLHGIWVTRAAEARAVRTASPSPRPSSVCLFPPTSPALLSASSRLGSERVARWRRPGCHPPGCRASWCPRPSRTWRPCVPSPRSSRSSGTGNCAGAAGWGGRGAGAGAPGCGRAGERGGAAGEPGSAHARVVALWRAPRPAPDEALPRL